MTYYCKNCNNIVGQYYTQNYCYHIKSKNFNKISFLDCKKCNKFIGILCYDVCKNCFGEYEIHGEKNLFNWFLKYKKIVPEDLNNCEICDTKYDFRHQFWFFEELTFYK